jgi:hypothetical protein
MEFSGRVAVGIGLPWGNRTDWEFGELDQMKQINFAAAAHLQLADHCRQTAAITSAPATTK